MSTAPRLPNLIVIGAMKCGTTALHRLLDAHPDIAMAEPKEMNFFAGPAVGDPRWEAGNWHRGPDWYAAHFPGATVRGEASPAYTSPSFPQAAARIAALLPEARLVYLVRDPLERAVSQYRHHRADGTEPRPLDEALLDPASQYVARSRFHERLVPYLERFARGQIAVVLQEELLARPRETLARIYRFAGVDDGFRPAEAGRRFHTARAERVDVGDVLERRFAAAVADDVEQLGALLGRELAEWRPYARPAAGVAVGGAPPP